MVKCAEIRIRAERKAGQMLKGMNGVKRGGSKSRDSTLKKVNVSKDQSSNWQKLAEATDDEFEHALKGVGENCSNVPTTKGVMGGIIEGAKREVPQISQLAVNLCSLVEEIADLVAT